jgi:uncharacterized membrane protein YkoI
MIRMCRVVVIAAVVMGLAAISTTARAQKADAAAKLPDPVKKAFQAKFPKGEILKVDAEDENGVKVYDIEFKDGSIEKETDIAADGTVIEVTVVVEPRSVPYSAMYAIRNAAPNGRVKRIERVEISYETKDGKAVKLDKPRVCFEVEMTKGNQVAEVVVAADGKVVKAAKWSDAKAEKANGPTKK